LGNADGRITLAAMKQTRPSAPSVPRNRGRTQAERTALSYERLLDAALMVFAERGFRNSSLSEIGERAGYSRALVTLRFGSKEGLLRELTTRVLQRWSATELAPALAELRGLEALRALLRVHRQSVRSNPQGIRALYTLTFEALSDMPELRTALSQLDDGWRKTIERSAREAVRARELPSDVKPRAFATFLLGALRGILLQWLLAPERIDLDASYQELERSLARRLT
jgi:AcrR family transcriptional regulator